MTRQQQLIERAARRMARKAGLKNLTQLELCDECDIAPGSFTHIMGRTFTELLSELYDDGVGTQPRAEGRRGETPRGALARDSILYAALELSKAVGYDCITASGVAELAQCSTGLIMHYFGGVGNLKSEVMRMAIKREISIIIAQGLVRRDPLVARIPEALRRKAIKAII